MHFIRFTFQTELNMITLGRQSIHEQHKSAIALGRDSMMRHVLSDRMKAIFVFNLSVIQREIVTDKTLSCERITTVSTMH